MQRFFLILLLISLFSCETPDENSQITDVERVVRKMNLALANHDHFQLLACYSDEMDWENSFGWTIRNKDTLNTYFKDWLFTRYPKLDSHRLSLKFNIKFISKQTAWVDVLQEINSEDMNSVVRTYRQTHLLIKRSDGWLIKKTRLWAPTPNDNPPIEFLSSPSFFE
ncbi:hypothetical protein [Allomuricauda sp. SCSIO 65647]|uniref:hypothetical protein n=1 Tax=Allomuricauda sp. SCSIO 65647 TaxID=2908843 RepID=UPI001F160F99|nr:hypothetical protein [Muricauda sp. SCSIO 65647]UJH67474.1 hypothetical protein L0P89_16180 [Muricauda sp. SCSIO 65647]